MIISRTPFRISFLGGGSDYPDWYRSRGGQVLASAIDKYCYITCRYLPPFFDHRYRVVYSKIEDRMTIDEIEHPSVRAVLNYLALDRGIEIHHDGDLPARSGMGSSSSFTVGLLNALVALKGQMLGPKKLASESINIEQKIMGETVGSQDQILASYGGLRHVRFEADGGIDVNPVILSEERLRDLNSRLMLFYTGIQRTASSVASTYVSKLSDREDQINSMVDMVDEGLSILSGQAGLDGFGALLDEAWKAKASLGSQVSNSYIDELYQAGKNGGALGGKLLGAGGGGFFLFYADPSTHETIKEKLNKLIHVPFTLGAPGSQIIFFDEEEDYSGTERIRSAQIAQGFKELV